MDKYFLNDTEVSERDAASAWFSHVEDQGIDISKAISIWEDAATEEGSESRRAVAKAGIRIEVDAR